jgi:hypothetical protein
MTVGTNATTVDGGDGSNTRVDIALMVLLGTSSCRLFFGHEAPAFDNV